RKASMRALALDYVERSLAEHEFPDACLAGSNDILLRVLEVGVCGTDRALASFVFGRPPEGESRLIIGHEALCEVVSSRSPRLRQGDLVVPMVRRPCPAPCRFCAGGRRDLCESGVYTERGILAAHGYFADMAAAEADDLIPVAATLRDVGILIEPLSVVEK